jgi:hypothetical protein
MQEPATREKWAKHVERWKGSGLSVTEFAAEAGINARSLSWWRWHLSKGDAAVKPRRRRRSPETSVAVTRSAQVSPITFVEMTASPPRDGLEVVLPSMVRVCVRPGFDAPTLVRLLDVLEHRR